MTQQQVLVVHKGQRHLVTPKYQGGIFDVRTSRYVYRTESNRNPMPTLQSVRTTYLERQDAQAQAQ